MNFTYQLLRDIRLKAPLKFHQDSTSVREKLWIDYRIDEKKKCKLLLLVQVNMRKNTTENKSVLYDVIKTKETQRDGWLSSS